MFRRAVCIIVVLVAALMAQPGSVPAQTTSTTGPTTTLVSMVGGGQTKSVIPRPNSGSAPQQMGDRGGAGQLALLGLLVVAISSVGVIVVRSTRRATKSHEVRP
jgi:hypothetical protein